MNRCLLFLFTALYLCSTETTRAQYLKYRDSTVAEGTNPDYILSYGKAFVARVFAGNNMNRFSIDGGAEKDLRYAANFQPNIGFGLSYSFLTVNLSFGVGDPPAEKGKTSSFSFQSNLYYRKWAVDFILKTYKGMYLKDENQVSTTPGYFVNPDLRSTIIGGAMWRILNSSRFSYKAIMTQSEWQKKSAGTFLLGAEVYYGYVHGHDSLVPTGTAGNYVQAGVTNLNYMKIGPGIGYAYTFVFKRHWFAAAALTANLDLSFNKEQTLNSSHTEFALQPNYNFRIGAGYNSKGWNIIFQFLNNNFPVKGAITDSRYTQYSGNYRLSFNRRFFLTKRKKVYIQSDGTVLPVNN